MKFCEKCEQDVRIRRHDGICPVCGYIIDEEDAVKKHGASILTVDTEKEENIGIDGEPINSVSEDFSVDLKSLEEEG